jgi:hypothetical protein
MKAIAYACDIGSIKAGSFAWARNGSSGETPTSSLAIDELIVSIERDVTEGMTIAIGFEAPLFMPVPDLSSNLNSGRNNESSRSMFAPAGATVTTIAIQQTAWILKHLHRKVGERLTLTMDWQTNWRTRAAHLFLWEAFVSSTAHSKPEHGGHERDAATALQYFLHNDQDLNAVNAVTCDNPMSLIAASALWCGWLTDIQSLKSSCLVLRPTEPYSGPIKRMNRGND